MKIAKALVIVAAVIGGIFLGHIPFESPEAPSVGGGLGTIEQLDQWKNDGTYITQNVASTMLKLTGLESAGNCLVTNASGVVSSAPCASGGGSGTVTSVALSVPTGLSVTGSPITTAGTLAVTYSAGYEGLKTASSSNWNGFYNTPSTRITAGTNLSWAGNTLNATGGSGGSGTVGTSTNETKGQLSYWTSTAGTPARLGQVATGTLSESVAGLDLSASRSLVGGSAAFSLTAGYLIPLSASTTNWNGFYNTPSTRITAGSGLSWAVNTLSAVTSGDWTGTFDGQEGTYYLARANHTGTQLAATISDFVANVRTSISETVTGLDYNNSTGVISATTGYGIPLTASTTNWNGFYNTPSTRITAGNHIDWTSNTLDVITTGDWTGTVDGNNFAGGAIGTGDLLYGSGAGTIAERAIGTGGQILAVSGGLPTWIATTSIPLAGDVTGTLSATVVGNDSHDHTSATLSGIDVSADTNLGVTATGLSLSGDNVALTAGYIIPLSASTTNWNSFYNTPSTRIADGTGLTWSTNTLNVDASQSISTLSNLTTNGFVKTSGGTGALSIDTSTYLTGNQTVTLSGDVSGSGATAITTTVGADKILESMLKSVNAPTDELCLTYESTTGDFEWQSCGAGGSTTWDAIGDPVANGAVAMAETIQSLDWDTGAVTSAAADYLTITSQNDAATDVSTQRLFVLENKAASVNTIEAMQRILNSDTAAVTTGLLIDGTGAFTTALDVSDADIVTALSTGANDLTGTSWSITGATGAASFTGGLTLGTALTAANGGTGITSLGAGVATWFGTPSSANLATAVTGETGSGALVFGTSPTITTNLTLGADTISDFTGLGLGLASGALGLNATGATDEYCLTYETTGPTTEWQTCANANFFTDAGAFTYLTSITDDFALGRAATTTAPFWWDVSATTTYIGNGGSFDSVTQYGKDGTAWTIGNDFSDSNQFKISSSTILGTSDFLTIAKNGLVKVLNSFQVVGALFDTSSDAGLSGQILSSTVTGTNWINNTQYNAAVSAVTGYAADTYLVGSSIAIPAGSLKAKTMYSCTFNVVKTGAGTATPIINIRFGTAGAVADTSRGTLTFSAQTAVIDEGTFTVNAVFRTVGSGTSAVLQTVGELRHRLSITGLGVGVSESEIATSAGFDSTVASSIIGLSVNGGASASWTISLVNCELKNLN